MAVPEGRQNVAHRGSDGTRSREMRTAPAGQHTALTYHPACPERGEGSEARRLRPVCYRLVERSAFSSACSLRVQHCSPTVMGVVYRFGRKAKIPAQALRGTNFMKENRVKIRSYALLLFAFPILAVPIWAGTIKEADYPTQYQVMNTSKSGSLVVEKFCSMTLRDQSKPNIAINVQKKGYGSCKVLDNGKVFHGRQNKKRTKSKSSYPTKRTKTKQQSKNGKSSAPSTSPRNRTPN